MNKLIKNKLSLVAASAALLALAQPVSAQTLHETQRVPVTGKPASVVAVDLTRAAKKVCDAALRGGRRNLDYGSCVTETLGQARADYAALRAAKRAS